MDVKELNTSSSTGETGCQWQHRAFFFFTDFNSALLLKFNASQYFNYIFIFTFSSDQIVDRHLQQHQGSMHSRYSMLYFHT